MATNQDRLTGEVAEARTALLGGCGAWKHNYDAVIISQISETWHRAVKMGFLYQTFIKTYSIYA